MTLFQAQVDAANERIFSLEERLRNSNEDCDFVRNQLYDSEVARYNEAHSRLSLQRHLQLEQHQNSECAENYRALQFQHGQILADVDAVNTLNAMLQQEIEHSQNIIDSMARKIAEYELTAQKLIGSQPADQMVPSAAVGSLTYHDRSEATSGSQYDSKDLNASADELRSPSLGTCSAFINEPPQLPSMGLGVGSMMLSRDRRSKRLGKTKAASKLEEKV